MRRLLEVTPSTFVRRASSTLCARSSWICTLARDTFTYVHTRTSVRAVARARTHRRRGRVSEISRKNGRERNLSRYPGRGVVHARGGLEGERGDAAHVRKEARSGRRTTNTDHEFLVRASAAAIAANRHDGASPVRSGLAQSPRSPEGGREDIAKTDREGRIDRACFYSHAMCVLRCRGEPRCPWHRERANT